MAISLGGLIAAGSAVADILLRPYRAIVATPNGEEAEPTAEDILIADAVISEGHADDLKITDHPVESGAVISDHAYKDPSTLTVVYGWSGGSINAFVQNGGLSTLSLKDPDVLKGIYERVLKLQRERIICSVYTGKRVYTSMLIRSCKLDTTKDTEHALLLRIDFREIIVARTQIVTVPDDSVQADPEANGTGNVISAGPKQLGPAPNFVPFDSP